MVSRVKQVGRGRTGRTRAQLVSNSKAVRLQVRPLGLRHGARRGGAAA